MKYKQQFFAPQPSTVVMTLTSLLNHTAVVGGVPGLNRVWGFRPLTRITDIDFPVIDQQLLRMNVKPQVAAFITPNHPEFFTDWMIDKYILAKVAPAAASWASGSIVNGMGRFMQRFWLANNLIAHVSGDNNEGKQYAVDWAAQGKGVLLHPEGGVGWHGRYIAPLFSGAAEMAYRASQVVSVERSLILPVVWYMQFTTDVRMQLWSEYHYICSELNISPSVMVLTAADGAYYLYNMLLARDEKNLLGYANVSLPFRVRVTQLQEAIEDRLRLIVEVADTDVGLVQSAQRWLRDVAGDVTTDRERECRRLLQLRQRWCRVGSFAWQQHTLSQEEVAEHLQRIRQDFCLDGVRNHVHRFIPRPIASRRLFIRALEPISVHAMTGTKEQVVSNVTALLRQQMQSGLDGLIQSVADSELPVYHNPFMSL